MPFDENQPADHDTHENLIYPNGAEALSFHAQFNETTRSAQVMIVLGQMCFGTDVFFDQLHEASEFAQYANNGITGEGEHFYPLAFDIRKDLTGEDELWRVIIHTSHGIIDTDILAYKDHIDFDDMKASLNAQTLLTTEQADALMQSTADVFKDEHGRAFVVEPTTLTH